MSWTLRLSEGVQHLKKARNPLAQSPVDKNKEKPAGRAKLLSIFDVMLSSDLEGRGVGVS